MAINRRFHGAPGPWRSARDEQPADSRRTPLPYRPQYRHHLWLTDLRYLVQVDGTWVYSLCILEGYSRKILAGMASPHQDLPAVLQIRCAALADYGCPQAVVSDNGSVFTAGQYVAILRALASEPLYIEQGKPWQHLIEAQFKVQLRLADYQFEQAHTFADVQKQHAAVIETFNTTSHWAHRDRVDDFHTPVEVLGGLKGRPVEATRLRQLFGRAEFLRSINRYGFVRVQRFSLYAETGLSRQRVSIGICEGELRITYHQTFLARYRCVYDPRLKQLQAISDPTRYPTPFALPQLELIELDDTQWRKWPQHPARSYTKRRTMFPQQLSLFACTALALIVWAFKVV